MTTDVDVRTREEIRELLTRYCRGVDRMDAELIASTYHPDAIDEHGITRFSGETVGAGIVALMRSARFSMHHITNQAIQVHDDDHGGCETYYVVWQTISDEGGEQLLHVLGRYVDRVERRGGEWRIAHRLVIVELVRRLPLDGTEFLGARGARRDRADPSYAVLARP
jgi:hypothetical protein